MSMVFSPYPETISNSVLIQIIILVYHFVGVEMIKSALDIIIYVKEHLYQYKHMRAIYSI
jgi:hypothetical protein